MRKKSHISLAGYLLDSMKNDGLTQHKKAFYVGSILPDCTPSFITRRHTIEETFDILKKEILKITDNYDADRGIDRYFSRHLGVVTHYLADYFTYPHNNVFTGNIKEHCGYEKKLITALRSYVNSEEAAKNRESNLLFDTVDEILKFIKKMHEEYLKVAKKIIVDCDYIVELCHKVVDGILQIFERNYRKAMLLQANIA